ncbi:MAG TPA: MFS transporter [Polyangiaceae bacterium]|jgi:OPA family glycerol-3-phosphate transporter-like MFS transporter
MVDAAPGRPKDPLARGRARTLFVLWVTYGSFYFCRANFGPARLSMLRDLGMSAVEFGLLAGSVKLGYALGQLVNGQLTERFGARRILSIGMIGSSAATLLIAAAPALAGVPLLGAVALALAGAVHALGRSVGVDTGVSGTLGMMILLSFANGWFQAGGWPPVVKMAARWFPVEHRGRTMGILGTSYTVGSAVAIFGVGALLDATGGAWRIAFVVPAALLLASFVHTTLRLREHPPEVADRARQPAPERLPIAEALRATLGNPRIWILALGLFGLDAVRYGFLDWAPGHLAEIHHTGALSAALKTAVFPLAGALGALSSGWITDRFFQSRRAPVCAMLLGGVGALTLTYRVVVGLGVVPTVVCLGLVGFCLYGAQILLVGTAAQDFARRGATAAAAGFVDFTGHVGAFSGDVVTGWMLKRHGWAGAIAWWAGAAFVAALLVATLWRARPGDREGSSTAIA